MSLHDDRGGAAVSSRTYSRRSVVRGAAWSVPVIVGVSALAPGTAAASTLTTATVPATAVPPGAPAPAFTTGPVTTVTLGAGQRLTLKASGQTKWGSGPAIDLAGLVVVGTRDYLATPDGNISPNPKGGDKPEAGFVPGATYGTLVGRFNQEPWFKIGSSYTSPVGTVGTLQLAYNDNPNGAPDNTGSYSVQIKVTP